MTKLPTGYTVVKVASNYIMVGMDFQHVGKDCVDTITHDGKTYRWGPLDLITGGKFGAMRRYDLVR
jgi:hypothetical protein